MIVKVQHGQSLTDIAVQRYGSAAALVELAADNNLPLDAALQPGQSLTIRDTMPEAGIAVFADYLSSNQTVVVSGDNPGALEYLITNDGESLEGIII